MIKKGFPLKCGIEIHTQLNTKFKLFSRSRNSQLALPNANTAPFDYGVPGTFPHLNPQAVLLAVKAAAALHCNINPLSSFDRKHYFYLDQPLGYQLTQRYRPLASGGRLQLSRRFDGVESDKDIGIEQLQLEQDTGKLNYNGFDRNVAVDLNRANVPLIELVTRPDFDSLHQVKAFVKKYLALMTHLGVCTGDLEQGAMRCDVNISVAGGNRVEIKNLGSTSEIMAAAESEYLRQVAHLELNRGPVPQETRRWNGSVTVRARSKEHATDYRYMPDPELPTVRLHSEIGDDMRATLPPLPDDVMAELTTAKFGLELKHARFFVDNPPLLAYYRVLHSKAAATGAVPLRMVNNWLIHELLGTFHKLGLAADPTVVPPEKLADLIVLVHRGFATSTSAKVLLTRLVQSSPEDPDRNLSMEALLDKYDLMLPGADVSEQELGEAIDDICLEVMKAHPDAVERVRNGKKKSLNFLLGMAMRETQGKVRSQDFRAAFERLIQG